ncbi:MAG TPA: helix-turn-helix domain-containing protein, partial [Candidatus Krumholzibacteria bacterium]|nr:helix-turn-helix domain-containing protein [Candidatus Krumholzibacteria bacterium]
RQTTKSRLLDAAEILFGEKGFAEVSVRELAAAADVNVAAVNYHFQGKENLFHEVLSRRFAAQRERTLAVLAEAADAAGGRPSLDAIIRAIVGTYMQGALGTEDAARIMAIITREMHTHDGTHYATVFKDMVEPVFAAFSAAMLQARPNLRQDQVNWLIASVIGQVHHFLMRRMKYDGLPAGDPTRAFMARAFPILAEPVEHYIACATDHITRFSTAAIDGLYPEVTP